MKSKQLNILTIVFVQLIYFEVFCSGQNYQFKSPVDILHYKYEIELNDFNDEIKVNASIKAQYKSKTDFFVLDLKTINSTEKGMQIDELYENHKKISFEHKNDKIRIPCKNFKIEEIRTYQINYHGIPDDGLIISKSKFGERVFFGDCWPNRAHHWLVCIDHPSDKATVEFIIKAPSHYQVVSNGTLVEETNIGDNTITTWISDIPLPTKVMVIGVAAFAKQNLISLKEIPVSSWVYPQNREQGFNDYKIAIKPLDYFIEKIGPYPYSKLANVQSKTVFGGMENAGCIFYFENSVTGDQRYEELFAHEIAHQWFGNSVTELNWHHIWLSEGFATYLEDLYMEHQYGRKEFVNRMKQERNKIIDYSKRNKSKIIDTTLSVSIELLSPNTYEKGAWFLHMLRKNAGEEMFWKCIQTFYDRFKYGNALSEDFKKIVEEITGKNYTGFFNQWLYKSGQPQIHKEWKYENQIIELNIKQLQNNNLFEFPLEIKITFDDNSSLTEKISVSKAEETFTITSTKKPKQIILDPDTWLLFEEM